MYEIMVNTIMSVDYDGTLVDFKGNLTEGAVNCLSFLSEIGVDLILFSCRSESELQRVKNRMLAFYDIEFKQINRSVKTLEMMYGGVGTKPYAHFYYDDQNIIPCDWYTATKIVAMFHLTRGLDVDYLESLRPEWGDKPFTVTEKQYGLITGDWLYLNSIIWEEQSLVFFRRDGKRFKLPFEFLKKIREVFTTAKPKLSPKMNKAINYIEEAMDVTYEGSSFEEASEFIGKYLDTALKVDIREKRPPSEKMKKGINLVEQFLGVSFEGKTMKDASEFLEEYLEKALEVAKELRSKKRGD